MDQDPNQDPSKIGDAGDNSSDIAPKEPTQNQNPAQETIVTETTTETVAETASMPEEPSEVVVAETITESVSEPAPEAVPVTAPQPVTENAAKPASDSTSELDASEPNPKPSRVPLIVLGILAVIVLILGCVGIWFYGFYNNPDKVALDAVTNLLSASNVTMNGTLTVKPFDSDDSRHMTLKLGSASNHLPNSTTASLELSLDDGQEINLNLGTVQMSDGVIYLQISKIMETIDGLGLTVAERAEYEEVFSVLEVIDNEWWRISIPELIDDFEFEDEQASGLKELYACTVNVMNEDVSGELTTLYRRQPFVEVKEIAQISANGMPGVMDYKPAFGNNLYEISLNESNLANFINALPATETAESFYSCYNNVMDKYAAEGELPDHISAEDFDEVSASDFSFTDDQHFYMEVSQFGHQIQTLHFHQNDDDFVTSGQLTLGYSAVKVTPPDSYRPITELVDELTDLIMSEWTGDLYDDYPEDDCLYDDTCHFDYDDDYDYDDLI